MSPEQLEVICKAVVELTKAKIAVVPHLCVANFASELLSKLTLAVEGDSPDLQAIFATIRSCMKDGQSLRLRLDPEEGGVVWSRIEQIPTAKPQPMTLK